MYKNNSLFPNKTYGYIISCKEVEDINTIEDWENAEMKYKILNNIECK